MRKIYIITILLFFVIQSPGMACAEPRVLLDGKLLTFDVSPTIEEGRTLVPLRIIFEALGATVKWDENSKTVTATKGNTEIKIVIGGETFINGIPKKLDVPAKIINTRTMVPLRFVSESLSCQVKWDQDTETIEITSLLPIINISPETYKETQGLFLMKYHSRTAT